MIPVRPIINQIKTLSSFAMVFLFSATTTHADSKSTPHTSVYSEVSPDYHRTANEEGGYKPETYVVGKGVCLDTSENDESLTRVGFWDVAHVISEALIQSDYIPAPDPNKADLMIVLSWGKTTPHDDGMSGNAIDHLAAAMSGVNQANEMVAKSEAMTPGPGTDGQDQTREMHQLRGMQRAQQNQQLEQMLVLQGMEQDSRTRANAFNARLLGYHEELQRANELSENLAMRDRFNNILSELESPRYFVILQAYDFQTALKEKKQKLLWTTRFSINAKGRAFDKELRDMALASAKLFGSDSKSLKRSLTPGHVEFGELEYLGVEKE